MKRGILYALAVIGVPHAAYAATEDFQTWNTVNLSANIAKNVPVTLEVSGRLTEDSGRLGVVIVRPAIGYRFSKRLTALVGYTRQTTVNRVRSDTNENRLHQQLNWQVGALGRATFASRTRLEQRWIEGSDDLGWRVRERLQMQLPLKSARTNLVLSSEVLFALNSTDWGAHAGFDQMRNFAGVNFPLSKTITLETGYQNRYQKRRGAADRMDHIIPITLSVKL